MKLYDVTVEFETDNLITGIRDKHTSDIYIESTTETGARSLMFTHCERNGFLNPKILKVILSEGD